MKKPLKNLFNCCKLQIAFKNEARLGNNFHLKNRIHNDLNSGVLCKFQCGLCHESYYGECVRHFIVRIGGHIGIPPLIKNQVKPKNSSVVDHLLFCNHSASYDDFSILTRENKNVWLKWFWITRDKLSLNSNISSAPLYLLDRHW